MIVNCLILHRQCSEEKELFQPINCFPPLFLSLENYLFNFFSLQYKRASRYNRHNNGESRSFFIVGKIVAEIEFHASSSPESVFIGPPLSGSRKLFAYFSANHRFVALSLLAHAVAQPVN
jgi:hypothetical protein